MSESLVEAEHHRTRCGADFEHDWHAYRTPRGTMICDGVLSGVVTPPSPTDGGA